MPYQKLTGILSICRKAGKIVLGFDPVKEALEKKNVAGVLTTSDISPKTYKEVCYFCQKKNIFVCQVPLTMMQFGSAVGRKAAVAAVLDKGFFDRINELCAESKTIQPTID
ncbi:MAG: ribosomal L7Ae/L30e/S12e/Gadd45 family protein [Oscillospiraceae bacterium]|nr:ribosomal L7Ae/L30e/S12e/Gadd45 family protein [Oscillospiraceae bacterium]